MWGLRAGTSLGDREVGPEETGPTCLATPGLPQRLAGGGEPSWKTLFRLISWILPDTGLPHWERILRYPGKGEMSELFPSSPPNPGLVLQSLKRHSCQVIICLDSA